MSSGSSSTIMTRASPAPPRARCFASAAAMVFMKGGLSALHQPLVLPGIVKFPGAARTGHDIQIIEVVAVNGGRRVVAARHHDHAAVLDDDGLVERAIVGIDALEGEALRRVEAVVVGFLEQGLQRQVVLVVL